MEQKTHTDGEDHEGTEYIGYDSAAGSLRSMLFSNEGPGPFCSFALEYFWEIADDQLSIWHGFRDPPAKFTGTMDRSAGVVRGAWEWPGGGYEATTTRTRTRETRLTSPDRRRPAAPRASRASRPAPRGRACPAPAAPDSEPRPAMIRGTPVARPPEVRHIMGMPIGIDVRSPAGVDPEPAFAWLREVDATFSTYRADSEISRLDRGERRLAECRPEVDEVLTRCLALKRETGGYFSARPAGRLDPSGLVKGWAVARAAELLASAGARDFCINAGGDVDARGRPAPDRCWRVGIRHPEDPRSLAAVLAVEDLAVATSGGYERGAHIVDPHTGRPPQGLLSVTVVGPDLGTADAYATAAFAMGADGPAWTATLAGYDALCVTTDGRVLTTPGFARHRALP